MPRQARKHNTSKYTPLPPRPAKGKTDEPELSDHSMSLYWNAPPSLPILLEWLKEQGIWLSEKLQVKGMPDGQGWGVVSTQVGIPLEVVCRIPRTAILSVHTSDLDSIIPNKIWRQIPLLIQLTLTLLHEMRKGPASRYYGYLQSLPRQPVSIVALWDEDELFGQDGKKALEKLAGTEMMRETRRMAKEERSKDEIRTYWKVTKDSFPSTPSTLGPPTFLDVMHAYSLVTSRAFQVDAYHGAAMVPLADIFNHREDNHVCFESDDFVCDVCGSLPACEHDELNSLSIPLRLSHLPAEVVSSYSDPSQNTVDLTIATPFAPDEEVFNTYGDHIGWSQMLNEWGFVDETGDPFGRGIGWELKEVWGDVEKREDHEARRKLWKSLCNREVSSEDEQEDALVFEPDQEQGKCNAKDSLLINSDGQISTPLLWACFATSLPEEEMEGKSREALVILGLETRARLEARSESDGLIVWDEDPVSRSCMEIILELLQERLKRMWHANWTIDKLCDYADALPTDAKLQKMALKLLIEERRVLEVVQQRWSLY